MKQPIPFGKYYLLERVNVGGMAEVYKAKATGVEGFERLVAVKRILPSIAEDEEFITMFVDEAKIAVQLTHASIAQIFDLGKVDDSYFIALEYVHGKDMRAIFNRARSRGERIPIPMACYTTMKVCEGLDYAHNKRDAFGQFLNLVHRDVSPQNLLISYDGEVKIIDFGIAKAAGKAGKTQAGILKGKFGYMSPEQVQGVEIDRRSDVFGVGICLYEMLTGERLFVAETDFATLEKVRKVDIVPPSAYNRQVPEELEQIVLKALARDRDRRHQTAMQLHDELQAFMYASGNFFARRDLSLYMQRVFGEEIQKESVRDKEYSELGGGDDLTQRIDEVTGLTAFDEIEPVSTVSALHAQPMSSPRVMSPSPPAAAAPRAPMGKSTLLGLPAAPMPQGPRSPGAPRLSVPPLVPRANSIPPSHSMPAQSAVLGGAAAGAPSARRGGLDMDWDDEEMSTQIYDRPDDTPAHGRPSTQGPFSPARSFPPAAGSYPPALGTPSSPGGFLPPAQSQPQFQQPQFQQPQFQQPQFQQPQFQQQPMLPATAPGSFSAPSGAYGAYSDYDAPEVPRQRSPMVMAVVLVLLIVGSIVGALLLLRPKAPGAIHIGTTPPDAAVTVDGRPVTGSSPFVIGDILPGVTHEVQVGKQGFRTWSTKFELQAGETMELPAVVLEALESGFALDSQPSGALVFVDGKQLEQATPVRITSLAPGDHQIRLQAEGYAPWESSLHVTPGTVLELPRAQLSPRVPEATSAAPEPAKAPSPVASAEPRPRRSRSARESRPEPVERPDPPVVVVREAPPAESAAGGDGTLRVQTRPWSQVYVDGRLIGNTPQMSIPVSAGSHTLLLVNEEFGLRKTVKVSVGAGEVVTKVLTLAD